MREELLEHLVCPACKSGLHPLLSHLSSDGHYESGSLLCRNRECQNEFRVVSGIPRMVLGEQEQGGASETFGFEWASHGDKTLEGETVFGRTQVQDLQYFRDAFGVSTQIFRDAVILDAGCGSGQLTGGVGMDFVPRAIIGIDANTAVEYPHSRNRHLTNVHIVQADIGALPFRREHFDYVWSNGVIHHMPDPRSLFDSLVEVLKSEGRLYVWVYERVWNPFRFTKDVLTLFRLRKAITLRTLLQVVKVITPISFVIHALYRGVRLLPLFSPRTPAGKRRAKYRSMAELELTWFDALSPKYDYRFKENEILSWFESGGFRDLRTYEHKVGVCGTKASTSLL